MERETRTVENIGKILKHFIEIIVMFAYGSLTRIKDISNCLAVRIIDTKDSKLKVEIKLDKNQLRNQAEKDFVENTFSTGSLPLYMVIC